MKQNKQQDIGITGPKPKEKTNKFVGKQGKPAEVNGFKGPEPTRYGDWEKKGRCIDF